MAEKKSESAKLRVSKVDTKNLTKGELRKLNMLRKSVGEQLGNETFAKWYAAKQSSAPEIDQNIAVVEQALEPLIKSNKLKIPRGGYLIRRGRGRIIVEKARQ